MHSYPGSCMPHHLHNLGTCQQDDIHVARQYLLKRKAVVFSGMYIRGSCLSFFPTKDIKKI
jgi:hypothetical protein